MKIRLRYIMLLCAGFLSASYFYRETAVLPYGLKLLASRDDNFSDSFAGSYLSGYVAGKKGQWEKAAELLDEAHKKSPENTAVIESTYVLRLLAGNVGEAAALARKYERKQNAEVMPGILLASDSVRAGDFAKAEKALYAIRQPSANDAPAVGTIILPFLSAWTEAGAGKYDNALSILKTIETDATYEVVSYHRALIYDMMGNTAGAAEAYEASLSGMVKPYHFVRAAGNFYLRHHQPDKARALYQAYLDATPSTEFFEHELALISAGKTPEISVPTPTDGFIESLMEGIRIAYQNNLMTEGLAYLQIINYIKPDFAQSLVLLANHYEEQGNFAAANTFYERISKDSDFYWKGQINIARNLYLMGDKENGEAQLRALIVEKPGSFTAPLELADLLRDSAHYQEAAAVYETTLSRIPSPTQFHWFIYYTLGISYEQSNQWDKAEKAFLKALELYPNQPDVLNYLGYSWLVKERNIPDAQKMIERAVNERPGDAHIMDSMGWALFRMGSYAKAVSYLEKAVEAMPYDPIMNEHLGDGYWQTGRKNEARFQWQRALTDKDAAPEQVKGLKDKLQYGLKTSPIHEQQASTLLYQP